MKTLKKVLSTILAFSMAFASMSAVSYAADAYNKNGDYATNGEFPQSGTILDWQFYAMPKSVRYEQWVDLSSKGISFDKYKWALDTEKDNANFNFTLNDTTTKAGDPIWKGASTIKTGKLKIETSVFIPEMVNPDGEKYTQLFSIWGLTPTGGWYAEQGSLYSIIMSDTTDPYFGFTTDAHHQAVTSIDAENGYVVKATTNKWYKLGAVIDYDNGTLDYYIDDQYICSHKDFAANQYFYEMGSLYYSKNGAPATNATHVYVTALKLTRLATEISATASAVGNNSIKLSFNDDIASEVSNNTFAVKASDGTNYAIESVVKDGSDILVTLADTFNANETVTVVVNEELTSKSSLTYGAGNSFVVIPKSEAQSTDILNQDFDSVSFPVDGATSKAFTDFYCEYPAYAEHKLNNSDFADAMQLLKAKEDSYFMGYTYQQVTKIDSQNGSGSALKFHRSRAGKTHNYWSGNAFYGLIIPFDAEQTVSSGKVVIEFDGGKIGNSAANRCSDAYTIGLHDANNEITTYDKLNAWSNSTALFGFGDYYDDATIISVPRGRSSSYTYYYQKLYNAPVYGKTALWPSNCSTVRNNNAVRHYKIDLNMDTKTYDIYQDGEKIGNGLSLPTTENEPSYDAFVLGSGLDPRIEAQDIEHGFYLDNLRVYNPDCAAAEVVSVKNADGTDFNGTVVDNTVVFNFNKPVVSADTSLDGNVINSSIAGNSVTVNLDTMNSGNSATLALSNITFDDGTVMDSYRALVMTPKAQMSGYFSESPAGYVLNLIDGGYVGEYNVFVASYDSNGTLVNVEAFKKEDDGIYPLSEEFDAASYMRGYVFSPNLAPLSNVIVDFEE